MDRLRAKSEELTGYLEYLLKTHLEDYITIITPEDPKQRGAQVSISVKQNGPAVYERLEQSGVLCDWREPDVIRVTPIPLYNTFTDVYRFVELFKEANCIQEV